MLVASRRLAGDFSSVRETLPVKRRSDTAATSPRLSTAKRRGPIQHSNLVVAALGHWHLASHTLTLMQSQCMMPFYALERAGREHCDWQHTLSRLEHLNCPNDNMNIDDPESSDVFELDSVLLYHLATTAKRTGLEDPAGIV